MAEAADLRGRRTCGEASSQSRGMLAGTFVPRFERACQHRPGSNPKDRAAQNPIHPFLLPRPFLCVL